MERVERKEIVKQNTSQTAGAWVITPGGMGRNIWQTDVQENQVTKDPLAPYVTMKEADKNGQGALQFRESLTVHQIKFTWYLAEQIYNTFPHLTQVLNGKKDKELAGKLLGELYANRLVWLDPTEYGEQINQERKEARKLLIANAKFFSERTYHWYSELYNPKTKHNAIMQFQTTLMELSEEVEVVNGKPRKKKGGELAAIVPLEYIIAVALNPSFLYRPRWLMAYDSRKETAFNLASRLVERYYQQRGKEGNGFALFSTALAWSGLDTVSTRKTNKGTTTRPRSKSTNLGLFVEAVEDIIANGGLDEEGTYFYYEGGERVYLEEAVTKTKTPEGTAKYTSKLDFTKKVFFHFKLNGLEARKERLGKPGKKGKQAETQEAEVVKAAAPKAAKPNPNGLIYEGALEND